MIAAVSGPYTDSTPASWDTPRAITIRRIVIVAAANAAPATAGPQRTAAPGSVR